MKKVTIFGDIMCEPLLLKAAKKANGQYDFHGVFDHMRDMITDSDYTIANLETPLAGKNAVYTNSLFSFNTPDSFADAIKDAGISLVTTANNHCLDRGMDGLIRTVKVLEEKGIPSFGTWKQPEDRKEAVYVDLGDCRVAVLSATYGTNYAVNHAQLNENQEKCISILHPYSEPVYKKKVTVAKKHSFPKKVSLKLFYLLQEETRIKILKSLHKTYNTPREDDYLDKDSAMPYFESLRRDIEIARSKADIVLFYPHVGGQFNINPGAFTKYTFEQAMIMGVDAIVASHPHIVQRAEYTDNIPCFYSIGNFSMSPNSVYLLHEHLPNYGLAVHLYIEDKQIARTTFSIVKMVENKNEMLTVWPVDALWKVLDMEGKQNLERDVQQLYMTVTGRKMTEDCIKAEYIFD